MKQILSNSRNRLALIILAGVVAIAGTSMAQKPRTVKSTANAPEVPVDTRPIDRENNRRGSFSPVVKKVAPGVVKVFTSSRVQPASFPGGGQADEFFRHFFGDPNMRPGQRQPGAPRQQGVGSGVITTTDGYILTNNHVVDGADEVKVALQDGREFTAKVVGTDPKTDIAVIKVDAKNLPVVPMADSDMVEVGDVVLAVGNPFGIGQTVTTGIVSATGRGNMGLDYEDFIQTDAAINPGNSGGALVDSEGRLIGINTAILSRSGGNQGIGFAIPSNMTRDVMQDLIRDGHVTRGYLGILIQDITPALAKQFELKDSSGALVGDVTPRSPAEKGGVKSGDVIVEVNDRKIPNSRQLRLEIARSKPDEQISIKILRDGKTRTLEVTPKALPGTETIAKNGGPAAEDTGTLNGVAVDDLNNTARNQMRLPPSLKGAVVTDVQQGTPAAEAGLRPGDVIIEINRKQVRNAQDAVEMTKNADDKTTLLRVWRDGNSRFVVVDEGKAG